MALTINVELLESHGLTFEQAGRAFVRMSILMDHTIDELVERYPCHACQSHGVATGRELASGLMGLYYRQCRSCHGRRFDFDAAIDDRESRKEQR